MLLVFSNIIISLYVSLFLVRCSRLKDHKRTCDPIDHECIDKTEFWMVEEEQDGELDYDELDHMLDEEEPRNNCVASTSQTKG